MYNRAINAFKTLVMGDAKIEVFLTDDNSLKAALSLYNPDTTQLLCLWQVNKNVEEKVNKTWRINTSNEDNEENKEKRKAFLGKYEYRRGTRGKVIAAADLYQKTEEDFEEAYSKLKKTYSGHSNTLMGTSIRSATSSSRLPPRSIPWPYRDFKRRTGALSL